MIFGPKISLGIDISDSRISICLLRQLKNKIELVKAVYADLPEGAVTDGNITDPILLGKAIKELLSKNRIRIRQATVSLVARPVLTQVIELPEELPGNVGQFVHSETRHSAILAGKEPHYDFCGLGAPRAGIPERIFVGATDSEKISTLLKALATARIEPMAIELSEVATLRALYSKRIANKYDCNFLAATLHGSTISICVFRKAALDFIRCVDLSEVIDDADECLERCADEIDTVIQFYDIEVEDAAENKWEVAVVFDDPDANVADAEFLFQKKFGTDAHVCSASTVYEDTPVAENDSIAKASITAVGLAMKQLDTAGPNVNIDLLPPEAEDAKAARKFILITANMAATILLIMFLIAAAVSFQLEKTQQAMAIRKMQDPTGNIEQLLKKQRRLSSQSAYLTEKKNRMDEICNNDNVIHWAGLLDDIRRKTPTTLCITRMTCSNNTDFVVQGESLSYKSIHTFAELLTESEYIESAVVAETSKNHFVEGIVAYSINCVLAEDRGLQNNAD